MAIDDKEINDCLDFCCDYEIITQFRHYKRPVMIIKLKEEDFFLLTIKYGDKKIWKR